MEKTITKEIIERLGLKPLPDKFAFKYPYDSEDVDVYVSYLDKHGIPIANGRLEIHAKNKKAYVTFTIPPEILQDKEDFGLFVKEVVIGKLDRMNKKYIDA